MYSTELIRKFPDNPDKPILYVVYNEDHIHQALSFIGIIHGPDYLDNVKVVPFGKPFADVSSYDVYIDPLVYKYQHSWND